MRILCKGFNLYDQLNDSRECVDKFNAAFVLEQTHQFVLGHTFAVLVCNNKVIVYCKLAKEDCVKLPDDVQIADIVICDNNILILSDSGEIFRVNVDEDWKVNKVSHFTDCDDKVKFISSRCKLNVAYTQKGYLYTIPLKLNFMNQSLVDVQTGREHCILLDDSGKVYTFGAGSKGQLGTGQLDDHLDPIQVEALAGIKIVKIAAGGWHSAAVSDQGDLYMWGLNGNGQLGLSIKDKVTVMATPQVVDIGECPEVNVLQVACGSKHTIALLENGKIYGCGWNKYKQLHNTNQEDYYSFELMEDAPTENIEKIICGPWNSAVICK